MILTAWYNLNKVILLAVVVVKWSAYVPYIPTIRVRIPLDLCKISVEKNENKIQTEAGLIHFLKKQPIFVYSISTLNQYFGRSISTMDSWRLYQTYYYFYLNN